MADGLAGLFSSAPGLERVNLIGLTVLAVGVIVGLAGGAFFKKEADREKAMLVRMGGLAAAIAGALVALYAVH